MLQINRLTAPLAALMLAVSACGGSAPEPPKAPTMAPQPTVAPQPTTAPQPTPTTAPPPTSAPKPTAVPQPTAVAKGNAGGQAGAGPATIEIVGTVVADDGFRPGPHGFAFQNYGNEPGVVNMLPDDVKRMFGPAVCAGSADGKCLLTPAGEKWLTAMNGAMAGGHCEGFAVLSTLLYSGKIKPAVFGGDTTGDLKLAGNEVLQREIAYWFATQGTPPSAGTERKDMTPSQVVDEVAAQFKAGDAGERFVVGIYNPGYTQGHAVTPFAVVEKDDGVAWLMVYDNNYPNQERYIEVNRKAETWRYTTAANPAEPSNDYQGTADSKTLTIAPISVRLVQQICPFCEQPAAGLEGRSVLAAPAIEYNQVWLSGDADLLLVDGQGRRLGYVGGKLVSEIPNAFFQPIKSGLKSKTLYEDDEEPAFFIPRNVAFSIVLDGSRLKAPSLSNVTLIGPGYALAVEDVNVDPGQKDTITFSPDGTLVTYKTTSSETPELFVGVETSGADYGFLVKAQGEATGQEITLRLDEKQGRLGITTKRATGQDSYDLTVERIDDMGEQEFSHEGIELAAGVTDYVNYAEWDGNAKPLTIGIDTNNDGKADETVQVTDSK